MTTMSTSRPSTTPMMAPVITPAWMGTVGGGEGKEKLGGRAEENDAENFRMKRMKSRKQVAGRGLECEEEKGESH